MAAELKINDSGTWRTITEVKVNDSGTWRTIQDIKVNDGGTWRAVWQYLTVTISNVGLTADSISPTQSSNTLSILSNGTWVAAATGGSTNGDDGGTWMTTGVNTDFEVRLTQTGGTTSFSGNALSTWLATTTNRSWSLSTTAGGDGFTATGTLEFRSVSSGTVLSTTTVDFAVNQT